MRLQSYAVQEQHRRQLGLRPIEIVNLQAVDGRVPIRRKSEFARCDTGGRRRIAHQFQIVDHARRGAPVNSLPLPTSQRNTNMMPNGIMDKTSAYGPSKNGLLAAAQSVSDLSTSPSVPAMNAMTMPAIAPPA